MLSHVSYRVTEEPYKIPYYTALLRALDENVEDNTDTLLGKQVLDDFWKGFQSFLDKLAWREIRLCVCIFNLVMRSFFILNACILGPFLRTLDNCTSDFGVFPACTFTVFRGCNGGIRCLAQSS